MNTKTDKFGDYLVNRINRDPWTKNSWILGEHVEEKLQLVIILFYF